MGKVLCEFSMSLDGYVAGPGVSSDMPMGEGGEALHAWMFSADAGPDNARAKREMVERTGAVILGRRTFDLGVAHWDGTPFPVPSFVLSHRPPPADLADGFAFVDSGIEAALRQAREAAGGRDVRLMGADVARQYLSAGQVDEVVVQLVPVLLGGGERLFPDSLTARLQPTACIATAQVTHLRYAALRE
jgi:dihydrofolate reductase